MLSEFPGVTRLGLAVLIPVLNRPHRVEPLLESLTASSRFIACLPVFIASPNDVAEHRAIADARDSRRTEENESGGMEVFDVQWEPGPGDYARKMNYGFRWAVRSGFELVFLGADDLHFHPGWAERALAAHLETGACVIGTNDGGNARVTSGQHSTHSLVHRDYLECGTVDEPGVLLHEGYDHQWVDNEFVETARWRGTFVAATDALVEHQHPFWGKAPEDETYARGRAGFHSDRALYQARRSLWEPR